MKTPRIILLLMCWLPVAAPAAADVSIWFEDAQHSPALSDDAVKAVAAHVRHQMVMKDQPGDAPLLPASVRDDFHPRIVILSASDGIRQARVAVGSARGVLKAAQHAMAQLAPSDKDPFVPRWLKLDHPGAIIRQENVDLNIRLEYERSLFGIAFPRQSRLALLPEELIANDIVNYHQGFFTDQLLAYLNVRRPEVARRDFRIEPEKATIFRFTTQGWYMDRTEIVPLYRGHRRYTRLTRDELKASSRAALDYLTRAVGRYGQFDYLYQPTMDRLFDDYNMVRHYGTILSMADAYEVFKDPKLKDAIDRAFEFGDGSIGMWMQQGKRVPAVVWQSHVNLGGNALALAALARHAQVTGDDQSLAKAHGFATAITVAQRDDGSFIQYQRFPDGKDDEIEHPYSPGEAIYALMFMQTLKPDPLWVDTADKAAQYLILVRDKDVPINKLHQDHWLLYGLNELHRHKPRRLYLDHTAKVVRAMHLSQHHRPPFIDWHGGYYTPPGSTPTSVRTEGLVAAYQLLRDHGDDTHRADAVKALDASILGSAFQLQCQYRPESAMYFKNPQRVLGAFRESLTSPNVRIDFVQHNMMALLNLWRVMEKEGVESYAVPAIAKEQDSEQTLQAGDGENAVD